MTHIDMGAGVEFDLVRRMFAIWGPLADGVGSDAAVLRHSRNSQLVMSVDSSVEGVHFRREWMSAREIGYRATAAALSDLAAAGARPIGILLALGIPPSSLAGVDELAEGIAEAVRHGGSVARILGGDTSRSAELTITVTAIGEAGRPLSRVGAADGDLLVVTGDLGRSKCALDALLAGADPAPRHRARFVRPEPRFAEGVWLAEHGATAAIDISDGLASELSHLAAASNIGLSVDLPKLPVEDGVDRLYAMQSGEEYELLASVPKDFPLHLFRAAFATPLTVIGEVVSGAARVQLFSDGRSIALPRGHDHF